MILIPLLALLAWTLAFRRLGRDRLEAPLAALTILGLAVSIGSELQSLVGVLTPAGSTVWWVLVAASALVLARRRGVGPAAEPAEPLRLGAEVTVPIVAFLGLTALVALVAAPNSYDGLTYHLVRVEQWVQQGSLRPFATHNTRQLFMPSWPEYAILQLRLLSGGDRFANLVQWLGLVGACGGAALLARALGGGRAAAGVAACLVATLPMAVAQASGTQTDLVAACWAVVACGFGYRLLTARGRVSDGFLSAAALGLAGATKQTALLFGGMALLPALGFLARRGPWRRWVAWTAAMGLAVAVIAGPQLGRNYRVFGDLRGDPAWLGPVEMSARGPGQVAVNLLRNLALHLGTPFASVNRGVAAAVEGLSGAIGVDPNDPRTTLNGRFQAVPWTTHEESAPNPLHLLVVLGCILALAGTRTSMVRVLFPASLAVGFLVFCVQLKWQPYNGRLHTPLFVLALAWSAVSLERLPSRARRVLLGALALASLPNALFNYTRPLLYWPDQGPTPRADLFAVPRDLQYFMWYPPLGPAYEDVARRIAASGCRDVGIRSGKDVWEYPVLALARQSGSRARFRALDVANPSARFAADSGPPCLLVQIGSGAAGPPGWAADWHLLADWHEHLGRAAIALFAPPS